MKKTISLVLAVLMIAALCSACGEMRGEPAVPHSSMEPMPEISPILSPDPEDGYVEDNDGQIEDGRESASPAPTGTPAPSSPASSPKPSKKP